MATRADFLLGIKHLLNVEGKYVNDPSDPGGATNFGITLRALQAWRPGSSLEDLVNISSDNVMKFYEDNFWNVMGLYDLPAKLSIALLDQGVNRGPSKAVMTLQKVLSLDHVTGHIGIVTKASLNQERSVSELVERYLKACEKEYRDLCDKNPKLTRFLKGWLNRVQILRTFLNGVDFQWAD